MYLSDTRPTIRFSLKYNMERKAIIRILIVAAVILFSAATAQQSELNAQRDFIYAVSIQSTINQEHICDGVILYDQWILTSAKCVRNHRAADLNIFYGSNNLKGSGKRVGIKTIVSNTMFDEKRFKDDAALLRTTTKIDFIANVSGPVTLPAKDVPINATLTVVGWKLIMNVSESNQFCPFSKSNNSTDQCICVCLWAFYILAYILGERHRCITISNNDSNFGSSMQTTQSIT